MREWIHRLGSMKLGILLLLVLLVAMAAGTIVESTQGSETALRIVYGSLWFRLLLGAFAVNLLLSVVDRYPWGRQTIGFVITHGSMLVVLIGALVTLAFKVEGHLALWEGEESAAFAADEGANVTVPRDLPFSVRLQSFEIDTYQGTHRPAMFRSRVVVRDTARGTEFPAVIEMNHELSYRGYRLFQSSYQQADGRNQTVLAVSKDPGQPIVFIGYGLLVVGMFTVLFTRISQRRTAARLVAAPLGRRGVSSPAAAALFALVAVMSVRSADAATAPGGGSSIDPATVESLRALPVQHDGRVMPLDTVARETVLKVTGARRWQGEDPVAVVLGWWSDPMTAMRAPVVKAGSRALAEKIGLGSDASRVSFEACVGNARLRDLIGEVRAAQDADRPLHGVLADASKLEERLVWMQGFLDGSAMRVLPGPDRNAEWTPAGDARSPEALLTVLRTPPTAPFYPAASAMQREILYNRVRPTRLAWWVLLASMVVSMAAGFSMKRRWLDGLALVGLIAGFGVMSWGIGMRWAIAGRIPASNMYESMLFLGWGVGLFALVAFLVVRNRLVIVNATAMSALAMVLVDLLPIDGFIHPIAPVLSGTPWLAIHVPIIMISYSVLALGVVIAHMRVGLEILAPAKRELAAKMEDLLYWYVHIGSILLIVGIMTGSVWAASSWGRYWGWDPKEVWSLIAFFAYLAILHGRLEKLIGGFGVAAMSIVAFGMILMTYIGVNFVLTSGMHSYGFGSSSVVLWLLLVAAGEALFLLGGAWVHRARRTAPAAPLAAH